MNSYVRTIAIPLSRYDELLHKEEKLNVIEKLTHQDMIGALGILEIIHESEEEPKSE